MSELKSCPFCGGEAEVVFEFDEFGGCRIECTQCGASVDTAAAWNTRHEGTCHDKNGFDESLGFECTVCRTMVDSYMQTTCSDKREQFHYCPCCGRKVEQ